MIPTPSSTITPDNDTSTSTISPEFIGVILAGTCGAKLFPLTSTGEEDDDDEEFFGMSDDDDDKMDTDSNDNSSNDGDNGEGSGTDGQDTTQDVDMTNNNESTFENKSQAQANSNNNTNNQNNTNEETTTSESKKSSPPTYFPKHMLPLAGKPILHHLLQHVHSIGLEWCIVVIGSKDHVTLPSLLSMEEDTEFISKVDGSVAVPSTTTTEIKAVQQIPIVMKHTTDAEQPTSLQEHDYPPEEQPLHPSHHHPNDHTNDKLVLLKWKGVHLFVFTLPEESTGNAEVLRVLSTISFRNKATTTTTITTTNSNITSTEVEEKYHPVVPTKSHVMVMPGDLIMYGDLGIPDSTTVDTFSSTTIGTNATTAALKVNALGALADSHRIGCSSSSSSPTAMTMLLTDVGEEDDNGQPLKESHKAKKGGLAREDEDIEFIALSTVIPSSTTSSSSLPIQRVMMKQSKSEVEEDDGTGATPQLFIPKARLRKPMNKLTIRTDWNDIHVFCFSPWIIKLLEARPAIKDLSKDLLPLLVTRQFKGVKSCFGVKKSKNDGYNNYDHLSKDANELKKKRLLLSEQVVREAPFFKYVGENEDDHGNDARNISSRQHGGARGDEDELISKDTEQFIDYPFMVTAQVLSREASKLTLRAHSIPTYMYSCREVATCVSTALKQIKAKNPNAKPTSTDSSSSSDTKHLQPSQILISLPKGSTVNAKDNTIMMKDSSVGDKVAVKSSIIGKRSKISNRCRLNNVVLMDDVIIGDNCVLQNTVVSSGSVVGNNCKLNDCQVGPGYTVEDGTKEKGESFQVDDDVQGFFE